jgi:hypothetical protein
MCAAPEFHRSVAEVTGSAAPLTELGDESPAPALRRQHRATVRVLGIVAPARKSTLTAAMRSHGEYLAMPVRSESIPPQRRARSTTSAAAPIGERMSWDQIRGVDDFRGRWVALDACRYDEVTGRATEGEVVDVDDDLAELCQRVRASQRRNCAIVFCDYDS